MAASGSSMAKPATAAAAAKDQKDSKAAAPAVALASAAAAAATATATATAAVASAAGSGAAAAYGVSPFVAYAKARTFYKLPDFVLEHYEEIIGSDFFDLSSEQRIQRLISNDYVACTSIRMQIFKYLEENPQYHSETIEFLEVCLDRDEDLIKLCRQSSSTYKSIMDHAYDFSLKPDKDMMAMVAMGLALAALESSCRKSTTTGLMRSLMSGSEVGAALQRRGANVRAVRATMRSDDIFDAAETGCYVLRVDSRLARRESAASAADAGGAAAEHEGARWPSAEEWERLQIERDRDNDHTQSGAAGAAPKFKSYRK